MLVCEAGPKRLSACALVCLPMPAVISFFGLRYAGKTIQFAKDKNALTVGGSQSSIDIPIGIVHVDELDDQFALASAERSDAAQG